VLNDLAPVADDLCPVRSVKRGAGVPDEKVGVLVQARGAAAPKSSDSGSLNRDLSDQGQVSQIRKTHPIATSATWLVASTTVFAPGASTRVAGTDPGHLPRRKRLRPPCGRHFRSQVCATARREGARLSAQISDPTRETEPKTDLGHATFRSGLEVVGVPRRCPPTTRGGDCDDQAKQKQGGA
jgi:hypothetical protein